MGANRPAVSVVVPFLGDEAEARLMLSALGELRLVEGDELIVADNTRHGVASGPAAELGSRARIVPALAQRSSYYARNTGAREAKRDWLLFTDSDCEPIPDLLDAYFAAPIPERCGALAGQIFGDPGQDAFLARYSRSRNFLNQTEGLHGKARGAAATGNLLVRRAALDQLDGFSEGIRSGGDVDFCWRLREAGWGLDYRPDAVVRHTHRVRLLPFLGMIARYASGSRWLNERHPGSAPRWPLLPGLRFAARAIADDVAQGRREEALFRAVDTLGLVAHNVGYAIPNRAFRREAARPPR